jgi:LysM repeat protein
MILANFFEPCKKSIVEATMSPGSPALAAPKAPSAPATPALAAPKTPAAPAPQSNRQYSKTYNAQTKQWTTNAPAANPMAQDPAQRAQNLQQAQQATAPDQDTDFDSYEQSGNTAVPMTKGGVGQNLYKMPVSQVPQGSNITQKYNNYQQQGDSAVPVAPNGGIDQLAKIPVSQVPKGANITQTPTPGGNLYKNLPSAGTLEEQDQPLDMDLVNQIYRNNKDTIGANPNIIEPKTMIDLPDGTPYEVQPGDTLSKIARKMPAIKAAAAASNAAVAPEPSFMDKVKQAASGMAAGQFASQAIPDAFSSLRKPAPVAAPTPAVKAAPEKVAPVDSLNPGEKIVVKSKVKPGLPPRTPSPQPFMPAGANPERPKPPYVPTPRPTGKEPPPSATPTGIAAAAEKTGGAKKKIGQAYDWLANLVRGRESGGDYDIGYHYDPGTGNVGPDKRLSSAWGAYGMTKAAIANARADDPTLNKPIEQWTPADQDRAFNYNNTTNIKRMKALDVDLNKHPEAPSIAMFLGADGAAEYYKTGKFGEDTLRNHGGEKGVRKIIATRTKDALDALEMQKKQKEKQKTKESTVAETVHTVKVMLETATTRDDVRRIKDYIDRQYTRHGLTDSVSFAQRNHLVEQVIKITGQRLLLA